VRAPDGGDPLYYSAVISAEQLAARQGLQATYTSIDGQVLDETTVTSQAVWHADLGPTQFPYELVLEGSLHVVKSGEYTLILDGDIDATVELDGTRILDKDKREARLLPAVGLHSISIRGSIDDSEKFVRLLWQTPDGEIGPIPVNNLYHGSVRPIGLTGRFFTGPELGDTADTTQVTPAMDNFFYNPVLAEPYIGVWEGTLNIETPGVVQFRVEAAGTIKLFVDGRLIASRPSSDDVGSKGEIGLQAGEVSIKVSYFSPSPPSQFKVLWAPLGRPFEPIPQNLLTPSQQHTFEILE
jgi:hypothetical protein